MIVFPGTPALGDPVTKEIAGLRRGTTAFIEHDPRDVALWRVVAVPNGSGGFLPAVGGYIYPQRMRLIPTDANGGTGTERRLGDGTLVTPNWVLLGEWNAEVRREDRFAFPDGRIARIVYVQEKRAYQTKAEVVLVG